MTTDRTLVDFDVVIVGAGIAGINFAYRLQERHPDLKYCILEGRHEIGGTWSLFKYPGIRSDSDLFTFGFPWRPWTAKDSIAHGDMILNYLKESAVQEGIEQRILYSHHVNNMDWSTSSRTWDIHITVGGDKTLCMRTRFMFLCTGYYDYQEPLKPDIPGVDSFEGSVVHPQFWPTDLNWSNKHVVIIGSGATAITLLPSLADKAARVTMLQRSPGYVMTIPRQGTFEAVVPKLLPRSWANGLIRVRWMLLSFMLVSLCQLFPNLGRRHFLRATAAQLPPEMSLNPDFLPSYKPWQQRMCMCPDGDFYEALRIGKASIKTGIIDRVTKSSIHLRSGEELHPDIIVTATGLKLSTAGGIHIKIDGEVFAISDKFAWNMAMLEDLPNAIFAWGYVDASWTLGAEATAQLACRLLSQMKRDGVTAIVPRLTALEKTLMKDRPFLALNSTYVERGKDALPRVGDLAPWQPRSYYWKDMANARWGDIHKGLQWMR
ncbi:hypothetical protein O9K51_03647 [Purpureocillium lavendulum]|uniref:Monooxygenase n=1 Tax=Purpureocillium lavendulum TaxID=1247861 RepID=A0AB34G3T4_9HYPO|nr:hypothetical protein O9K51_03647 [Purpureocillium lavendulum]